MGATANLEVVHNGVFAENSIEAFNFVLNNNSNGIELDVYSAKDDIIVIHGDNLEEYTTNASGKVADFSVKELKLFDLKHGGKISTLKEVLELANIFYKEDILINIEIKGKQMELKLAGMILEFIKNTNFSLDNFLFNSFDWDKLRKLQEINRGFKIALNLKSKLIFDEENIVMPGYKVRSGATVSQGLFDIIDLERKTGTINYIDCVIGDLRKEVLDFCSERNIGISTSCPNYRRGFEEVRGQIQMLLSYQNDISDIIFKADNVCEALQEVKLLIKNS